MENNIRQFRELDVSSLAMEAARENFKLTKSFSPEEKYSFSDQVSKSSRSVCAKIAEAWRKRWYSAAFASKLSEAEANYA